MAGMQKFHLVPSDEMVLYHGKGICQLSDSAAITQVLTTLHTNSLFPMPLFVCVFDHEIIVYS
jgi:hypothetical protein